MKVLVVDDSTTMQKIICAAIKGLGDVETETACDGEDVMNVLPDRT